jgi:hypothetical protein
MPLLRRMFAASPYLFTSWLSRAFQPLICRPLVGFERQLAEFDVQLVEIFLIKILAENCPSLKS